VKSSFIAFAGKRRIAAGTLLDVALAAQAALAGERWAQVLIFDKDTSEPVDLDLRGTADDLRARFSAAPAPKRPGRPKLGVVAREVTLLPRHWEWLATQPGGASVALRKIVEQAMRTSAGADGLRRAQESAYRFLSAMAGNEAGFEEAIRALFAGNRDRFEQIVEPWPPDIRDHARTLAAPVFTSGTEE
jgi:uncharacterized protein